MMRKFYCFLFLFSLFALSAQERIVYLGFRKQIGILFPSQKAVFVKGVVNMQGGSLILHEDILDKEAFLKKVKDQKHPVGKYLWSELKDLFRNKWQEKDWISLISSLNFLLKRDFFYKKKCFQSLISQKVHSFSNKLSSLSKSSKKYKLFSEKVEAEEKFLKRIQKIVRLNGNPHVSMNRKLLEYYLDKELVKSHSSRGLIELFATLPDPIGKTHESLIVLNLKEAHILKSSFIAIHLNEGGGGELFGDPSPIYGDKVYIFVEWFWRGKKFRARAEDLIWDKKNNKSMPRTHWVYTGSYMAREKKESRLTFAADRNGALVATYYHPDAILNNPLSERVDDTVYYVNDLIVPPKGTPVTVVFTTVLKYFPE